MMHIFFLFLDGQEKLSSPILSLKITGLSPQPNIKKNIIKTLQYTKFVSPKKLIRLVKFKIFLFIAKEK